MKDCIKFPYADRLDRVVDEFKIKWGVPQCFGAVDGCHVPISAPSHLHTDYYNRKGWYSMSNHPDTCDSLYVINLALDIASIAAILLSIT